MKYFIQQEICGCSLDSMKFIVQWMMHRCSYIATCNESNLPWNCADCDVLMSQQIPSQISHRSQRDPMQRKSHAGLFAPSEKDCSIPEITSLTVYEILNPEIQYKMKYLPCWENCLVPLSYGWAGQLVLTRFLLARFLLARISSLSPNFWQWLSHVGLKISIFESLGLML